MTGFYGPAISLTVTSSKFLSSISQELQMLRRSLTPYSNSNLLALLIRHYRIIKCLDFEEFSFWSRTIGPSFIRVKHYYFTQLRAKAAAKVAAPQLVFFIIIALLCLSLCLSVRTHFVLFYIDP